MESQAKPFFQASVGAILSTLYTVPADTTILPGFVLTNCGGTAATVRLFAVPPEGTPDVANAILYDMALEATETKIFSPGIVLAEGWTLQAVASQHGTIGITASGLEVTP